MRDLAQGFSTSKRSFGRKKLLLVLAVLTVVGVGLSIVGSRSGSSGGSVDGVTISDAPPDMQPVSLSGSANVASGGVDLKTETARMKDLRGGASATVTRSYGAGVYRLDVSANLPDPVNVNYAVWLVGNSGPILIDYMRGKGTSWNLSVSGPSEKYLNYGGVLITLERQKDELSEEKVMEGSF